MLRIALLSVWTQQSLGVGEALLQNRVAISLTSGSPVSFAAIDNSLTFELLAFALTKSQPF